MTNYKEIRKWKKKLRDYHPPKLPLKTGYLEIKEKDLRRGGPMPRNFEEAMGWEDIHIVEIRPKWRSENDFGDPAQEAEDYLKSRYGNL